MKATLIRQYRSREKGTMTFVYALQNAEKEQLEAYKKSKGEFYREQIKDEPGIAKGTPLYFSTRYLKSTAVLMQTAEGKWVPDTTEDDQLISMTTQCGGNVELAKELLRRQGAE
jgi:hypothetical protein